MSVNEIPDDVRRFVLTSIASVPHLEALLLLRGSPAGWRCEKVAERLYISEKNAHRLLLDLCDAGILACAEEVFTFRPESDAMRAMIDRVAQLYSQHLVAMTNLIHARMERKAHQFADAFDFRKKQ